MNKKNKHRIKNQFYGDQPICNVGTEFLRRVKGYRVLCVEISLIDYETGRKASFCLKQGFSRSQFREMLNKMTHCWYDCGYGIQHLYGNIWCDHGIWFERSEYDGAECWNLKQYPIIPDELLGWLRTLRRPWDFL